SDSLLNLDSNQLESIQRVCGKTRYYLRYRFPVNDTLFYKFTVELDENFQLLAPLELPNVKENSNFYKVMTIEKAYQFAKKVSPKSVKYGFTARVIYFEKQNAFAWEFIGVERVSKKSKEFHSVQLNAVTGFAMQTNSTVTTYN
ncbi:MAG: hypothetical protein IT245_05350, partial [Bacteroidia bacterium]|nr:hypothetical protein [Bacteroidia bacterium]